MHCCSTCPGTDPLHVFLFEIFNIDEDNIGDEETENRNIQTMKFD